MADEESPAQPDVHHSLNESATDPDPTEWPDPYDKRPDPRDPDAEADEMDFGGRASVQCGTCLDGPVTTSSHLEWTDRRKSRCAGCRPRAH